jgi:long-chain acyl-CoA synthetase
MKLKEDMNPLLLQVFRSVVWVYSVITFLPWYFLSGTSTSLERARRQKARSITGHTAGPYRAINSQQGLAAALYPGLDTLDKVFEHAATRFPARHCLGTRQLLSEEDELQPNGKVFKKVRRGSGGCDGTQPFKGAGCCRF